MVGGGGGGGEDSVIGNDVKLTPTVELIGSIYCRFFLSKYVHCTSLPRKDIDTMATRNFRLLHSLTRRFGMMESHVKTVFPIQFQHTYFCCLFYSCSSLFILVANVFNVLPCLLATVRRFLHGWVGMKRKRRNDVSCGNFGVDATPKL